MRTVDGLMKIQCAHKQYIENRTWKRCRRAAVRKSWRHRRRPDLFAKWLCWDHFYAEYLESGHWDFLRKRKFAMTGRQCERCGSDERLQIHHRTYATLGNEQLADLEVLCRTCHKHHHGILAA